MLEESQVEDGRCWFSAGGGGGRGERVVALTLHIIFLRDRLVSKDSPVHLVN